MALSTHFDDVAPPAKSEQASTAIRAAAMRLKLWIAQCADAYAAAVVYDRMRGLSDAELRNMGLSRETLARDVRGSISS